MADTAVADPDTGLSPAALAARHGLTVAGERPTLAAYARQLWSYRHFVTTYANSRVAASFSMTKLGRLWQVLTPLSNAAVYFLIFGVVLNTQRDVANFIAYLCTGLFVFIFTQAAVTAGLTSITGNLGLIRALHFPRAVLPTANTIIQFQHMVASMVVLLVIILLTGEPPHVEWLLLVPTLLLQTVFTAGLAMAMARIGSKIIDLKQVMPFILRTWLYASGVLYSVTLFERHLPDWAARIMEANPMVVYIELARHSLMENVELASPLPQLWLMAVGWALLVGALGFVYFWRGEQEYGRG